MENPIPDNMPILQDLYEELKNNEYDEAKELAVVLEMYVTGSYSLFNNKTNVNIDNRIVCYDIKELSGRLKDMGMLIIQNAIWDRVTINRAMKKKTRLYIDEFHLLLKNPQTANYSVEMWKRFRKWGGVPTGLTQNVSDFLKSKDVEAIFGNSEFVLLLSQNPNDADTLADYFQISDEQINYCKDVPSGHGLIIFGNNCILPFKDDFPRNTKMYSLLTSKLEEVIDEDEELKKMETEKDANEPSYTLNEN
jgi:type IV secretory pathway VirB4 component